MAIYLLRHVSGLICVLLAMSFVIFCLQSIIPADPGRAVAGPTAPTATVEAIREHLGLDRSVIVQYGRFLGRLAEGDIGISFRTRQPVMADVGRYLPASLELITVSVVMGILMAGGLSLLRANYPRSGLTHVVVVGVGSMPIFLSALVFVYCFWFSLDWLPGSGRLGRPDFAGPTGFNILDGLLVGRPGISLDALSHILLPSFTLALPIAAALSRSMSGTLHEVLQQPYIRTARGKGITETRLFFRHALRNAASAPLAMLGFQIRLLFGNLLIVERIFGWPGLGNYMVQSLASSDLPAVLGVSLVFGTIYILVNIVIEICQSLADPRIDL